MGTEPGLHAGQMPSSLYYISPVSTSDFCVAFYSGGKFEWWHKGVQQVSAPGPPGEAWKCGRRGTE